MVNKIREDIQFKVCLLVVNGPIFIYLRENSFSCCQQTVLIVTSVMHSVNLMPRNETLEMEHNLTLQLINN